MPPSTARRTGVRSRRSSRASGALRTALANPSATSRGRIGQPPLERRSVCWWSKRRPVTRPIAIQGSRRSRARRYYERVASVRKYDPESGRLAQLVERLPYKQEVACSSQAPPTVDWPVNTEGFGGAALVVGDTQGCVEACR